MLKVLLLVATNLLLGYAARILLMIPVAAISHQVPFRPLAQELARRGHEVVVVTTDPAFKKGQAPINLTEIDVHHTYSLWNELYSLASTGKSYNLHAQLYQFLRIFSKMFELDYQTEEFQRLVKDKDKSFDLLLVQECSVPTLGLSFVFEAPVILISSFSGVVNGLETMGAQTHPLLYPGMFAQKLYNLTYKEKIKQLINFYKVKQIVNEFEEQEEVTLKRIFGPDVPTLKELRKKVAMFFINVHPLWEDLRPVPMGVVYIGGIQQRSQKVLPKDLQFFLDNSKHGVIYVSFGTKVDTSQLPPEKVKIMIKVFSQLPYDVLWKWSTNEMPGQPDNIKISKWFPQPDLLRHPNVKLFITQGGLQSTEDAIIAGVPLIGVPMYADQWYNVEKYKKHEIGLRYDMETLEEETFVSAVETIINDESYRKNIIRFRSLVMDQPETALHRAVWWTEHVLEHGGTHLQSPAANISWIEYFEIELLFTLFLAIFILIVVTVKIFKLLFGLLWVKYKIS